VNLAGGHFYTSGAFWSVAVPVLVGVLAIAATIWVTLRAANPKRRLYYSLPTDTPLIRTRKDLSEELKVIYGTRELESPRVVNVQLASRGRRDISREAFDGERPLCLDIGTRIVECVKVTTSPSDRPDPSYKTEGSKLLIGPSHFGKRQTTVFSLLVDGKYPKIVKPRQSLVDVEIRQGDQGEDLRPVGLLSLATVTLALLVEATIAVGVGWVAWVAGVAVAGCAGAATAIFSLERWYRYKRSGE